MAPRAHAESPGFVAPLHHAWRVHCHSQAVGDSPAQRAGLKAMRKPPATRRKLPDFPSPAADEAVGVRVTEGPSTVRNIGQVAGVDVG